MYTFYLIFFRTFDYIKKELDNVPLSTPVLILANHRDMGHHRVITEETIRYYIEELHRYIYPYFYY